MKKAARWEHPNTGWTTSRLLPDNRNISYKCSRHRKSFNWKNT